MDMMTTIATLLADTIKTVWPDAEGLPAAEEIRGLLARGVPAERLIAYGLEYKFVTLYLQGELPYAEMREKLAIAIHQFAKRQMTWFRGMERSGARIHWVNP